MIDARTPGPDGAFVITDLLPRWLLPGSVPWRPGAPDGVPWNSQYRWRAEEYIAQSVRTPNAFLRMSFT